MVDVDILWLMEVLGLGRIKVNEGVRCNSDCRDILASIKNINQILRNVDVALLIVFL
jgi:hypothetical protein